MSLAQRIKEYESCHDYKIIAKLPIIIRIDGKNFHRVTQNLQKPFSKEMWQLMAHTMLATATEIQGCIIGYQAWDEFTLVLRNDLTPDSEPWFDNRIQKLISSSASLATYSFKEAFDSYYPELNLVGPVLFDAKVFAVPNITEAVNCLIWRQQDCISNSINLVSEYELSKKLGRKDALETLKGKSEAEKKSILLEDCGVDFEEMYSSAFRRGLVAAKMPISPIEIKNSGQKWALNMDLPIFTENQEFIYGILVNGKDIYRETNIS